MFIDWRMPGMDGWETCARIRQVTGQNKAPIIVMVTAHDREELAKRSTQEQALLNAYLVKPVTPQMLLASLHAEPEQAQASAAKSLQGMRDLEGLQILLAEDNPNNQQVAYELLTDEGAAVDVVSNGQECVQALIRRDGFYDIVLMDIQMPVLDGLNASMRIRELIGERAPPIVAMTANAQEADRAASLEAGMVDHVGKPFDLNELVDTIRLHTRRERRVRPSAPPLAAPQGTDAIAQRHGIQLPQAIARLGGRLDVYSKLLESFRRDLAEACGHMNELWQSGQIQGLSDWLHTIKGLAGTLGFQSLADTMARAEQFITQAPEGGALPICLVNVEAAVQAAQAALNELSDSLDQNHDDVAPKSVDRPILLKLLNRLLERLEHSDMQALDIYDEIVNMFGSASESELHPLHDAMSGLDFATARELVEALIKRYKTE